RDDTDLFLLTRQAFAEDRLADVLRGVGEAFRLDLAVSVVGLGQRDRLLGVEHGVLRVLRPGIALLAVLRLQALLEILPCGLGVLSRSSRWASASLIAARSRAPVSLSPFLPSASGAAVTNPVMPLPPGCPCETPADTNTPPSTSETRRITSPSMTRNAARRA